MTNHIKKVMSKINITKKSKKTGSFCSDRAFVDDSS